MLLNMIILHYVGRVECASVNSMGRIYVHVLFARSKLCPVSLSGLTLPDTQDDKSLYKNNI